MRFQTMFIYDEHPEQILFEIEKLKNHYIQSFGNLSTAILIMNEITLRELQKIDYCNYKDDIITIYGIEIVIDNRLAPFNIIIKDNFDPIRQLALSGWERDVCGQVRLYNHYTEERSDNMFDTNKFIDYRMPEEVFFNKDNTVLKWPNDKRTIARCDDVDSFDPKIGFLYAYFYKHCGLSKSKAKKYLQELDEKYKKQLEKKKSN